MSVSSIVRAEPADVADAADVIAEAFHSLPAAAWLVPDPQPRARMLAGQFAMLVEHALAHGVVYWAGDRSGVAVWFDRTRPAPEPRDYQQRLAATSGEALPRFQALDQLLEDHHPAAPHHHLALLAVKPAHQGRGLGTSLLRHHHARLDANGVPAYLEASSIASRDLYARHGYLTGEPFRLPDGTPFWPMWRDPAGSPQ